METIHKYLKKQGLTPFGAPIFKLVWSEDEREMRRGTFNEFYGEIFLRTFVGVKNVPKYNYIKDRWILEKWQPSAVLELPESERRGTYEPFYVFEDTNHNYLEPNLKAIEFLIEFSRRQNILPGDRASQLRTEAEEADRRQYQRDYDAIDSSPIQNALHLKEGVGYGK